MPTFLGAERMPHDLMWEAVGTGLNAKITHSFGAPWWVSVVFPFDSVPESVLIKLLHSSPGAFGETIFLISMPFEIPRWASDTTVCTALTDNLYEALANTVRLYNIGGTLPVGHFGIGVMPNAEPEAEPGFSPELTDLLKIAPVSNKLTERRMDRLCSTISDKHSARLVDGWGE